MDVIKIRDLEIYGHHGVMKEENVLGQKFLVSLALYTDTRAAGESDNLADSVNYAEVSYLVKEQMEKETYRLIEAAAEQLAKKILLKFPLVKKVEVEIKKPWAPILLPLDTVSVSITRGWETAYLSIGSNMGDRKAYLEAAIEELKKVEISDSFVPYIANVTADYVTKKEEVKPLLASQVSSSVRWQQTIERLLADGADEFVEIGPGRTLSGFVKKVNRDVKVSSIDKMEDFIQFIGSHVEAGAC
mgnify:CR=1 FL=1